MKAIVLDCAVAGPWNFREPWNSPKQGQCVRVAYACLGERGVSERGVLILQPTRELVVTGENLERGGITMAGLRAEGFTGSGLAGWPFWRHLQQADTVITFCQAFHIGALNGFGGLLGIDLAEYSRPRFIDMMARATPLAKVPWPGGQNRSGRDPYKSPSLEEAHDLILGGSLAEKRRRALASDKPVAAFGLVQVDAIIALHAHAARPPDVDRFAMA